MKRLLRLLTIFTLPAVALVLSSCATKSGGPANISKVKTYHLKPGQLLQTEDQMIQFECQHRMHGAITSEDYAERYGNYYTVFWKNQNKVADLTLQIEYTQAMTGADVKTAEIAIPNAGRSGTSEFRITGADYSANGPVNSWRITLLEGEQVVSESKSFLWK